MVKRERSSDELEKESNLNVYQTQLLKNIRLMELLKSLLEIYNKLVSVNMITRVSSLLCGISSDCLCKLGKCPGIHGLNKLDDFKEILITLGNKIVIYRISETNESLEPESQEINLVLENPRDYSIEIKMDDVTSSKANLTKKLKRRSMEGLVEFFKTQRLNFINSKVESIENCSLESKIQIKEVNLEETRIKRIETLISMSNGNNRIIDVEEVINIISKSNILKGGIVSRKVEDARETKFCCDSDKIYSILDQRVLSMLKNYLELKDNETFRFYDHQSDAIKAVLIDKKNVIITTSTSSGKSICYLIPSIQMAIKDPKYLTFIIFPTKALSEDQFLKISKLINCLNSEFPGSSLKVNKLDGDINMNQRRDILLKSNIILTNIDFIHWNIELLSSNIFNRLKLLVIDEAHIYTGHFGINTSYILKRLFRGIQYFKQKSKDVQSSVEIQFILCTATIKNPLEHFSNLTGSDSSEANTKLVINDTSSRGESTTLIWDCNKYNNVQNLSTKKNKSYKECINLLIELYYLNRKLILFCSSRRLVENIKRDFLITLKKLNVNYNHQYNFEKDIQIYRGGISQTERRKLEAMIFSGEAKIVISTVALELGIDVKSFDTVIVFGYPGSINRLVQQFGRCGRDHSTKSIKILLLNERNEIDNYISNHCEELLSRDYDSCVINLKNPYLLILHILCLTVESYKSINIQRDSIILNIDSDILRDIIEFLYFRNLLVTFDYSKVDNFCTTEFYYNWNRVHKEKDAGIDPICKLPLLNLYFENGKMLMVNTPKDIYRQVDVRDSDLTISLFDVKDSKNAIDTLPIYTSIRLIFPESIYSINGILYKTLSVDLNSARGIMQEIKKGDFRLKQKTVSSGEVSVLMSGFGEKHDASGIQIYIAGAKVTFDIYMYSVYEIINNEWIFMEEKYIRKPLVYSFSTMGMQVKICLKEPFQVEMLNIAIHGIIHNLINSLPKYISCNINDILCECPDIKIHNQKEKQRSIITILLYENKKGGNGYFNELMKRQDSNGKPVLIVQEILQSMKSKLEECNCKNGCLSCGFLLYSCIKNNKYINKQLTINILDKIIL
ncbi:putative ATP-dependent helicase hrq1 [Cryptosporidium felis]|nr:putative ATP-dependent helicase hrq1 [Cryptosporidium felis]